MNETCFGCRGYKEKIGVLLGQLGTPDEPTRPALRKYLKQFLSDRRVIEVNPLVWIPLLNGVILQTRPQRSARLYNRIWTKEGSPLLAITKEQTAKTREALQKTYPNIEVEFGMRYGSNSNEQALDALLAKGCTKILLFPMYPQYSATTTASTYDSVFTHLLKRRWVPTLRVAEPYYRHKGYVRALGATINEAYRSFDKKPEALVLSYHGIPEAYINKGDPYCCMCTETTQLLYRYLDIGKDEVIHTYQSRFGKDPWLVPYTDVTIEMLAKQGVKHIAVACPGFTADCLETLDEIGNEGSHAFKEAGGERLDLIPCLNAHPLWIEGIKSIIEGEISTWLSRNGWETDCEPITCPVQRAKAIETVTTKGEAA